MKQEERMTKKKIIIRCECKKDKRYRVGFRQIPHTVERNVIYGISTINNDMDCRGDYVLGTAVDRLSAYEDTGLSPIEVEDLQGEVKQLKARLEKAVELPFIIKVSAKRDDKGKLYKTHTFEIEKAEARLAEIKEVEKC